VRTLTSVEWDVLGVPDVDEARGEVLFAATKDGPTERHIYRVPLAGGEVERISTEPGWHGATFHDAAHDLFVESFEDERTPPLQRVRRRDGTLAGELPSSALVPSIGETNPIPEFLTATADRDLSLDLRVLRARAGGAGTRRPLVLYVYGGPGAQQVARRWPGERGLVDAWLARRGFFVARADARGVVARGHASERIFAGRLGDEELADQVAAVHALIERYPEIDPERVGIWGWSYGGYLTLMAMLRAPDVFRAGVSVAPVVDWRGYDTHYTERYLGLPSANAVGYDSSSVLTYVTGLEGHLTLVHGVGDDNVHFRESMRLVDALVEAGKQFDLMVYPGTHMMESVPERMHIYELVWRAFEEGLADGGP
jgi:dipeptidyl-peptidase-4